MRLTTHEQTDRALQKRTLRAGTALALLSTGLLLVFALDQATGSAPVQHLYYLPIIFAAVRFGYRGGAGAPLAAIVLYHLANPGRLTWTIEGWDVVQVLLFVAVGLITARLTEDKRRLRRLASTDDLTGLHNLRSFERKLARMIGSCRDASVPVSVLVLDVDRLKLLNDTYGHLVGAEAVQTVGCIIAAHVPPDAVACRYGGDEFAIALPRCTEAGGRAFADTVRHAVYATAPVLGGVRFPIKTLPVSVGVACQTFELRTAPAGEAEQGVQLFRAADRALYQAKEYGRNHVCVA